MLTYQVRPRVLMVEAGQLPFPNHVEIQLTFDPSPAFGGVELPGRTVRLGSIARNQWDANHGRSSALSMPPLDSLEVSISSGATNIHVSGTTLTAEFECDDRPTLLGTLAALRYLLPMVLNVEFSDPPVAATSHGRVGDVEFNWQVEWTTGVFEAVDQVTQESKVRRAWERLPLVADGGSARLRASLYHFYKACRLEQAGSGPSEFLAEILLNLAKALEALFPASDGRGTRDSVRDNLRNLGYSESELENHFLPAMALRDELDVAHVSLTRFRE